MLTEDQRRVAREMARSRREASAGTEVREVRCVAGGRHSGRLAGAEPEFTGL